MDIKPLCRHCDQEFGNHATTCPVKFRDTTNPDPDVQQQHEELDKYYERYGEPPIT